MNAVALFLMPLSIVANANAHESKGHFVPSGGGMGADIRKEFLRLAGGKGARIVIIPSASGAASSKTIEAQWRSYGFKVTVLDATDRRAAANAKLYHCLDQATGVWIGGGDQGRLMKIFGASPLADKLKAVQARGGVIGGTGAGSSVVTQIMISRNGESRGLGLLKGFIIDQHFSQRNRRLRLIKLVDKHKDQIGYGIDERTALVISGGSIKVVGEGTVTRYEANGAKHILRVFRAGQVMRMRETKETK